MPSRHDDYDPDERFTLDPLEGETVIRELLRDPERDDEEGPEDESEADDL